MTNTPPISKNNNTPMPTYGKIGVALVIFSLEAIALYAGCQYSPGMALAAKVVCLSVNTFFALVCGCTNNELWGLATLITVIIGLTLLGVLDDNQHQKLWSTLIEAKKIVYATSGSLFLIGTVLASYGFYKKDKLEPEIDAAPVSPSPPPLAWEYGPIQESPPESSV